VNLRCIMSFVCSLLVVWPPFVFAESWTWDGGSPTTDAWSDRTNWVGNSSVPVSDSSTDLIFGNSPHMNSSNNLGTFLLRDIVFTGPSAIYVVGDRLEIYRSIISSSTAAFAFFAPVTLGADVTARSVSGTLGFMNLDAPNGYRVRTEGDGIVFFSSMSGSGGVDVYGPGQTVLGGWQSYTGDTRVYGGTLLAVNENALQSTRRLLVHGTATAQVSVSCGLFAPNSLGQRAEVIGAGAVLDARSYGGIGMNGSSNLLTVESGGQVFSGDALYLRGSNNTIKVSGANSRLQAGLISVEYSKNAYIEVTNGARLDVGGIMSEATASGTVIRAAGAGTVLGSSGSGGGMALYGTDERIEMSSGVTSYWAPLLMGSRGVSTVSGAVVSASGAGFGMQGVSNSVLLVGGSRVDVAYVQLMGNGHLLEVSGAGTVLSNSGVFYCVANAAVSRVREGGQLYVGGDAYLNGTVTVQDQGSAFMVRSNVVILGGTLKVQNGAMTANTMSLPAGGATVQIDGGALAVSNLLSENGEAVEFSAGTISVARVDMNMTQPFQVGDGSHAATLDLAGAITGTHKFAGGLIIRPNATLSGQGTIENDVTVQGVLSPGHSAGQIIVASNITFDISANTIIEIFGPGSRQRDIVRADSVTFAGALDVGIFGFTPTNGARFRVFEAASYSGSFAATNIYGFVGGFDAATGEVFVTSAIPEASSLAMVLLGVVLVVRLRNSSNAGGRV
jgi:autotransporter-associated beta strand protein